jgi:hypothetical protein
MEVEFLSHMRYSLLASAAQWEEWLVKLSKFWEYTERAIRQPISPIAIPSPLHRSFASSPLPSPTGLYQPTPTLPSNGHHHNPFSPALVYGSSNGKQAWPTYPSIPALSPSTLKADPQQNLKKRPSIESDPVEPPSKRSRPVPMPTQPQVAQQQRPSHSRTNSNVVPEPLRLPVPSLTLNTNQTSGLPSVNYPSQHTLPSQASSALSLPPLVPGMRAMATVYPTAAAAVQPMQPFAANVTTASHTMSTPAVVTPVTMYPTSAYGTPTKRLSPQNTLTPYASTSPSGDAYFQNLTPSGAMSGVHTPLSNSPSVYLQHRASPYKPVRHVNTLLYPPPSASLQDYHLSNSISASQMQYQPLGKRDVFRTGIVPEFIQHPFEAAGGRHHAVTPSPMPLSMVPSNSVGQQQRQSVTGAGPAGGQYPG